MLISVVIPVYNLEDLIPNCIESILAQRFEDFEAIFIDDGSKDNSGVILDSYAEKHSNIKVIHSTNGGVNAARNLGVENAIGDYICFVDGDDMIPENALNVLFNFASANRLDIAIGAYYSVYGSKKIERKSCAGLFNETEYIERLLSGSIHSGPCSKLIKRELFDKDTFQLPRDFTFGEDMVMNIRVALKAKTIGYIPTPVYLYLMRADSSAHTFNVTFEHELELERYIKKAIIDAQKEGRLKEGLIRFKIRLLQDMLVMNSLLKADWEWIRNVTAESKLISLSKREKLTISIIQSNNRITLFRAFYKIKSYFIKTI